MLTAGLIKAARALLDWKQLDLAEKAGVSLATIQRMENLGPDRSSHGNVGAVQKALEAAGVQFSDNGDGEGVRLVRPKG